MKKIKVLVVDDSAFMRKVISDILNESGSIEVIDTARNGKEAIEKNQKLSPDVITLDVEMPILNGIEALKEIMDKNPTPILMLSSLTKEGADLTLTALDLGAVDFITKPKSIFKIDTKDIRKSLIEKVKIASRVRVKKKSVLYKKVPTKKVEKPKVEDRLISSRQSYDEKKHQIVAIGTSTGGPRALQSVIPFLSVSKNASYLIVQHMPAGFTKSLAQRMDKLSDISVKEAENGEEVLPGWAYIAPGGYQLGVKKRVNKFYLDVNKDPLMTGHRPSVDYMLSSLAKLRLNNLVGVIMTGMGSDGTKGLVKIKENNAYIIAQDEESSVVYGMPGSAVKAGVVDKIVPLNNISREITRNLEV